MTKVEEFIIKNYSPEMSWKEFTKKINAELGCDYSPDSIRHKYYKLKDDIKLSHEDEDNFLKRKLVLEQLKVQARDERTQLNALVRRLSREETLKEIAQNTIDKLHPECYTLHVTNQRCTTNHKDALLLLSDWHYGYCCKTAWNEYNTDVAKDRLGQLLNKVIAYVKKDCISNLHIINLGDLICGRIHYQLRINSQIDVVTQVIEIGELLSNFLLELTKYVKVDYYDTLDNHSRVEPNKDDSIDLESFTKLITEIVKLRCSKYICVHDDCTFEDDILLLNINNKKIVATHGHNDKVSSIISRLNLYAKQHLDLIISGHIHHFMSEEDCDTLWIANGSLMGTDDYAKNKRLHSTPSQLLIEMSDDNVCETLHRIILD